MFFKLFDIMGEKFYVIVYDSKFPKDYEVAWEIHMKVTEYREILIREFGGKKTHVMEDIDEKSNNIYFTSEEAANKVMAWLDSVLVANKLCKKKHNLADEWFKYIEEQIMKGLGIPEKYIDRPELGSNINKIIPNKNGRTYAS